MSVPAAFAEPDLARLHDFIEQNSFGLLVSQVEGQPFATHLPFLLERAAGPRGRLVGHMARANPQWEAVGGQAVLAVFSGPHAYISPRWYEAEQVVPTWNYTAVHAYGRVQVIEGEGAVLDIVRDMLRVYEQAMARPWSLDPSSTFGKRMDSPPLWHPRDRTLGTLRPLERPLIASTPSRGKHAASPLPIVTTESINQDDLQRGTMTTYRLRYP